MFLRSPSWRQIAFRRSLYSASTTAKTTLICSQRAASTDPASADMLLNVLRGTSPAASLSPAQRVGGENTKAPQRRGNKNVSRPVHHAAETRVDSLDEATSECAAEGREQELRNASTVSSISSRDSPFFTAAEWYTFLCGGGEGAAAHFPTRHQLFRVVVHIEALLQGCTAEKNSGESASRPLERLLEVALTEVARSTTVTDFSRVPLLCLVAVLGSALRQCLEAVLYAQSADAPNARRRPGALLSVAKEKFPEEMRTALASCVSVYVELLSTALPEKSRDSSSDEADCLPNDWYNTAVLPLLVVLQWAVSVKLYGDTRPSSLAAVLDSLMSHLEQWEAEAVGRCLVVPRTSADARRLCNSGRSLLRCLALRRTSRDRKDTTTRVLDVHFYFLLCNQCRALCRAGKYFLTERSGEWQLEDEQLLWLLTEQLEDLVIASGIVPPSVSSVPEGNCTTHRTIHTSLNQKLDQLWQHYSSPNGSPSLPARHVWDPADSVNVQATHALLQDFRELLSAVEMKLSTLTTPLNSEAVPRTVAVLVRSAMAVEVYTSFQLYEMFQLSFKTEVDAVNGFLQGGTTSRRTTAAVAAHDAALVEQWRSLLLECLRLRHVCCRTVLHTYVRLTTINQTEHAADRMACCARGHGFLHKFDNVFSSLLRRHYVFSWRESRLLLGEVDGLQGPCKGVLHDRHVEEEVKGVCQHWLHLFLRRRDIASLSSEREAPALRGRHFFQCCGTNLAQALEVCFFLSVCSSRWPAILPPRGEVEPYIQEVLLTLEHATAKQLWHLRSTKVLHYFTGERRDHTYLTDANLRHRHAQSLLSVVHAHVCHPSLLWMPLWQVQELVSVLVHFPALLFREGKEGGPARATTVVGSRRSDLSVLHRYLVSRIFVLSNVLRQWRRELTRRLEPSDEAPALLTELQRLERLEPAKEAERHRQWAVETTEDIWAEATLLRIPAEVEGTRDLHWGAVKAFQRLERTIQQAGEHGLLLNLVKGSRDTVETRRCSLPELPRVVLTVCRHSTSAPLGFVLRGSDAVLLSVDEPAEATPLSEAAAKVGEEVERLVGSRVEEVDGIPVSSGMDVARLLTQKENFTLTFSRNRKCPTSSEIGKP